MDSDEPKTLIDHFSGLKDARDPSECLDQLIDILIIAIAAVLGGANDCTAIESFGTAKIDRLYRNFKDGVNLDKLD
jgi:hypothetical protein